MQQQQQQTSLQTTGHVSALDNKRNYKPLRLSIAEASGQTRWFSAFEAVGRSLEAGGQGSGPWTITYIERPYTTAAGATGVNLNIRQAVLGGQPPQAQPQAQPVATPSALSPIDYQPPVQYPPNNALAWSLNMDDRGRAIIRQVAFKAAVDVAGDGWVAQGISDMTDTFERIILGTYEQPQPDDGNAPEPAPAPPPDQEFIQESF